MGIYSYIITRDYGFAPNPFYGYGTLATCKPGIRKGASVGDWVLGTGSCDKRDDNLCQKMIYAMQVQEILTLNDYWEDKRFYNKRPVMNGSKKQMYGDNIYHYDSVKGIFIQENSHHSLENGETNLLNLQNDINGKNVLISKKFWYFGRDGISIPQNLSCIVHKGRNYSHKPEEEHVQNFEKWIEGISEHGYIANPKLFSKDFERFKGDEKI